MFPTSTTSLLLVAGLGLGRLATSQSLALTIALFQDTNCQTPVAGAGNTTVNLNSCDTGPFQTGWSSAKITDPDTEGLGVITFYTKNNCGCPTCGSHGYGSFDGDCLTDFGFTANAVGYGSR